MQQVYIRTDKNGTRIYHDYECPRCGGAGFADNWINTGRVCYACGGTGKRARPKVVKEFTPEYWAKLEARRIAKQEKYAEEHADEIAQAQAERAERESKWRAEQNAYLRKTLGCGGDGIGFVLTGNTYRVKDKIRANGGRWISQAWVCPGEVNGSGIRCVRIDINGFLRSDGIIDEQYVRDIIFCIGQKGMTFEQAKAQVDEWRA